MNTLETLNRSVRSALEDTSACACARCREMDDEAEGTDTIPLRDWTGHPALYADEEGRTIMRWDVRTLLANLLEAIDPLPVTR